MACAPGELSLQPTWPHVRHSSRSAGALPRAAQDAHVSLSGGGSAVQAWEQGLPAGRPPSGRGAHLVIGDHQPVQSIPRFSAASRPCLRPVGHALSSVVLVLHTVRPDTAQQMQPTGQFVASGDRPRRQRAPPGSDHGRHRPRGNRPRRPARPGPCHRAADRADQATLTEDAYDDGFHMYDDTLLVVVTGMKQQLKERSPAGAIFRRLGRSHARTLLETTGGSRPEAHHARRQAAYAARKREDKQQPRCRRRKAEREARRPVCAGCASRRTDARWKAIEPAGWGAPRGTHPHLCGDCKQRALRCRTPGRTHPARAPGSRRLGRSPRAWGGGPRGRSSRRGPRTPGRPRAGLHRATARSSPCAVAAHRYGR